MNTMFDSRAVASLQERLARVTADTRGRWGSFTVSQMVCHLVDQMDYALSHTGEVKLMGGPPMFIRHLVRLYLPWPKGAPTMKEMLVTEPASLAADIDNASRLMDDFRRATDKTGWPVHPFFGPLNAHGWAKLTWRHNDYHLKQFGV